MNYFRGIKNSPYHLSVGAVVMRQDGKILCHHYKNKFGFDNLFLLMSETLEPHETIESAIDRGLKEEFGIKASFEKYLGSTISFFPQGDTQIEKTTLYFLCHFEKEVGRDQNDPESQSTLEWIDLHQLIKFMQMQTDSGGEYDKSAILKHLL